MGYVVDRFDRGIAGKIHIEDFVQILGLQPNQKYLRNQETLFNSIMKICGEDDFLEAARRLRGSGLQILTA